MGRRALLFLFCVMLLPAATPAAEFTVAPLLDVRVRQEYLDGVLFYQPDPSANWIRVRTRAGARADLGRHGLAVRLDNEHRRYLHPDRDFTWGELILDRAFWQWRPGDGTTLTVGRQDIIWSGGFLVLDSSPLDGSRSIYQDAARLQHGPVDLFYVRNLKQDHLVLAGNQHRPLRDMDETAVVLRVTTGDLGWSAIYKDESDPDNVLADLATGTLGLRYDGKAGETDTWLAEAAFQFLWRKPGNGEQDEDATALALQAFYDLGLGDSGMQLEMGGFLYSGNSDKEWASFRTPWGRWPKWSELYIYTLIGESTPGRVTAAAWENIAAPRVQLRRPLGNHLDGRLGLNYLLAPEPDWQARGLLTQAELKAKLGAGFTGHLLWEMLVPGSFHDGSNGLPPLTDTVHFLRWQVMWAL